MKRNRAPVSKDATRRIREKVEAMRKRDRIPKDAIIRFALGPMRKEGILPSLSVRKPRKRKPSAQLQQMMATLKLRREMARR